MDALELLSDIMRPLLRESDFDTEKQVILEEIAKYADQPDKDLDGRTEEIGDLVDVTGYFFKSWAHLGSQGQMFSCPTKIVDCGNQPFAKMVEPHTIHHHSGCGGVTRLRKPIGKGGAPTRCRCILSRRRPLKGLQ